MGVNIYLLCLGMNGTGDVGYSISFCESWDDMGKGKTE
jgi:hypothetical protein